MNRSGKCIDLDFKVPTCSLGDFACTVDMCSFAAPRNSSSFSFSLCLFKASDFSFLLMDPLDVW
jgi:hypothetical protein